MFAPRVTVAAGVCLQGKGLLHFDQEKSVVNADYYMNELLPKLMDDCHHLLSQHYESNISYFSKMEHLRI